MLAFLFGGGCASAPPLSPGPETLRRASVADVPFFSQEDRLCGASSLAMVLAWSGRRVGPAALAHLTFTPRRGGALQIDLLAAARRHGRIAYPVRDLEVLLGELAGGHPVLVLQNLGLAWLPRWHYAVAIGFDLDAGTVTLHTGTFAARAMPLATFLRTWQRGDRFGLVALPADVLPAALPETPVLEAIAQHEYAWPEAAERAYLAATQRFESVTPWIGLGNARVAQGDLPGAEQALREATRRYPRAADAYNNLAHVLSELGRRTEAGEAIARAIELGGPNEGFYRQTSEEIRAAP